MASYDSTLNGANPTSQNRGPAFGPIQSSVVANQGAPQQPIPGQSSPAMGSPGGSPGSVAQGAFPPAQMPPQLAQLLMGMNPNQPQVPNSVPSMPGSPGGMGGGAFASGFGNGTAIPQPKSPMVPGANPGAMPGAFGRS